MKRTKKKVRKFIDFLRTEYAVDEKIKINVRWHAPAVHAIGAGYGFDVFIGADTEYGEHLGIHVAGPKVLGTMELLRTIAHECAHSIQQRNGTFGNPDCEMRAEEMADIMVRRYKVWSLYRKNRRRCGRLGRIAMSIACDFQASGIATSDFADVALAFSKASKWPLEGMYEDNLHAD